MEKNLEWPDEMFDIDYIELESDKNYYRVYKVKTEDDRPVYQINKETKKGKWVVENNPIIWYELENAKRIN